MIQHCFKRRHSFSDVIANVSFNLGSVKRTVNKIPLYSLGLFTASAFVLAPVPAQAQDMRARAIMNSTRLLGFLDGVIPEGVPTILRSIESGKIERVEPSFPVWILSSDTGNIMYYQGQKEFAGQAASRLVDDNGFRFGLRAVENARKSRGSWVKLTLGGQLYEAYCAAKAPFVVCSLNQ